MRRVPIMLLAAGFAAISSPVSGQAQAPPMVHGGAPSVSPDGTKIAFLSERDRATDVFVINVDGTGELRVTHTPESESAPAWSADGKTLFYTVFDNGSSRIYSVGVDGKNQTLVGKVPGSCPPHFAGKRNRSLLGRHLDSHEDVRFEIRWLGFPTAHRRERRRLGARWSPDGKSIAFADGNAKGELTSTRSTRTEANAGS